MKLVITYQKSRKAVDQLVKWVDPSIEKVFVTEQIEFTTNNETPENIKNWLSRERKEEFNKVFKERFSKVDPEYTYEVTDISLCNE